MPSPTQSTANVQRLSKGAPWYIADYLETADGGSLGRNEIVEWSVRVYAAQSVSEDVAVYSLLAQSASASNADGSPIWLTAVSTDAMSPTPRGRTACLQLDPELWDAEGGQTYTAVVTASLDVAAGSGTVKMTGTATIRPGLS